MGIYNKSVITDAGRTMVAQAMIRNSAITFVSVKTSSYKYPDGTNLAELTELRDVMQIENPTTAEILNGNTIQVRVRFDNTQIPKAYFIQTLGVYAKIEAGTPILFSIIEAVTPDQMPAHSDVSPSAFIYDIQTVVQEASQIIVETNLVGTASVADIEALRKSKADVDHVHYIDLDEIEEAFRTVFTYLDEPEPPELTAMTSEDILRAISTPWNGESSTNPNALSASEIEEAIRREWNGESSDNPNSLSAEEINQAIANATN